MAEPLILCADCRVLRMRSLNFGGKIPGSPAKLLSRVNNKTSSEKTSSEKTSCLQTVILSSVC